MSDERLPIRQSLLSAKIRKMTVKCLSMFTEMSLLFGLKETTAVAEPGLMLTDGERGGCIANGGVAHAATLTRLSVLNELQVEPMPVLLSKGCHRLWKH